MSCEVLDKPSNLAAQDYSPGMTSKDKALGNFRFWFELNRRNLEQLPARGNTNSINEEYANVILAIIQDQRISNRELRQEAFGILKTRSKRSIVEVLADQDLVYATLNFFDSLRKKLSA